MKFCHRTSKKNTLLLLLLGGGVILPACLNNEESTDYPSTDGNLPNASDTLEEPSVGEPIGELIAIDHKTVRNGIESNIENHVDGLQDALQFLTDVAVVEHLRDFFFLEDDQNSDDPEDELSIDFGDFKDALIDTLKARILVEETASLSADNNTLTYLLHPEYFCASEAEEDESQEEMQERLVDEQDCANRLTENPIRLQVVSDDEMDFTFTVKVGEDEVEALQLQIHNDFIAVETKLSNIQHLVRVFVDEEHLTFPQLFTGSIGGEIRKEGSLLYTARFAILDDIRISPDAEDFISLSLDKATKPGSVTIDGVGEMITGGLHLGKIDFAMPWQNIVDGFFSDDDSMEWMCEINSDGTEVCYEQSTATEEAPQVEGMLRFVVAGMTGEIDIHNDTIQLFGLSLGQQATVVSVAEKPIVSVDINPDDGRQFGLDFTTVGNGFEFAFSPLLDASIAFSMEHISDIFEEMPNFLKDEQIGVRFDGSQQPILYMETGESFQMEMASGQMVLWSSAMDEDIIIGEGMCVGSINEDTLTDEEKAQHHELFGGVTSINCENE